MQFWVDDVFNASSFFLFHLPDKSCIFTDMKKESEKRDNQNLEVEEDKGIRLNKFVANAGICARRKADVFISRGHVTVDDKVVKEMGYRVKKGEIVKFNGKVIELTTEKVYLLLNKPKNVVTTTSDEKGRRTVIQLVERATTHRIYPVGRLDLATTGLLLITNDGDLAKKLSHPSHGVKKVYQVELDKNVAKKDLDEIRKGLILEDGKAIVDKVNHLEDLSKVGIEIHMGKNRIIRRIFEHLGYRVVKLDRVYYGGLTKKDLPRGRHRHLTKQELIMLKHFV